ncbi:iron ABC transporter substrate-binding protein [Dictyobacter alpinus]|uniref:Iron ABC transporter substrate-binding protein n=1 Tax=Dictyobacter alpinus TaxID=2014873 RepID=A0A402BEK1_9CHLR|nr:extracellular solute-binding protein [Dictyobacter alpinus]GCE29722.1 iron ABC transporter substrate-binding protein [Dictyobacter alpinus]
MRDLESFERIFSPHSRRRFLQQAGALGVSSVGLAALLEGCGGDTTNSTGSISQVGPIDMQTLISNAKKEGKLQGIGISPEWANYRETLATFAAKYVPIEYQAEALFSSAQQLEVFTRSKSHPHGDISDAGFKFGTRAKQQGLVAAYKHAHWDDVPANLKDPDGYWCTEYYGTEAFVINTDIVKNPPTSFKELLSGNYRNQVGIDGDPRQSNDAFIGVYSAALAMSGSLNDIQPGIDFFKELKQKGNFTPAFSTLANMTKGEVAIGIMWDFAGLGYRDQLKGKPNLKVIIPSDGSIAGPDISFINKTAPDPYAARLWIEHIYSDEGQLSYLRGYAHPVRYQKLVSEGKVPQELAAKLPAAEQYAHVKFVTDLNLLSKASTTLVQNWSTVFGQ